MTTIVKRVRTSSEPPRSATNLAGEVNCGDCRFWERDPGVRSRAWGACRIRAPWPGEERELLARWPLTLDTDWCGESQPTSARP